MSTLRTLVKVSGLVFFGYIGSMGHSGQVAYAASLNGSIFNIISKSSGKCLDIGAPQMGDSAPIIQNTCGPQTSQQWKWVLGPSGQYEIQSVLSGMCFDVSGASKLNGGVIKQSACVTNRANQLWKMNLISGSNYQVVSVNSTMCLDDTNWSTANNTQMQQWTCGSIGQANQVWTLSAPEQATASAPVMTASPPIVISGKTNVTISNVKITNPSGPCILIENNSSQITITNSVLGPCTTSPTNPTPNDLTTLGTGIFVTGSNHVTVNQVTVNNTSGAGISVIGGNTYSITQNSVTNALDAAIKVQGASSVSIQGNTVKTSTSGIYVAQGSTINVQGNNLAHIQGKPRGNFVQFNNVTGAGNRISCNTGLQDPLGTANSLDSIEDDISLYQSSGLATDPILVVGNKVSGGGPSATGGGIMLGDSGGSYITAMDNVVITPGGYGMSATGGTNLVIKNNKIYSTSTSIDGDPLVVYDYNPALACSTVSVQGNQTNWANQWGPVTAGTNWGGCSAVTFANNTFSDSTVTPSLFTTYKPVECP